VHILGGGLLRCAICWSQGRSSALHIAKSRTEQDTASFACCGRFQGFDCAQPSIPEQVLEAQVTRFFAAFRLPEDYQQRIVDLYARDQEQSSEGTDTAVDPVQQRAQLEARLERQQQLYELGDWTRERYLQARQEVLAELATLDAAQLEQQPVRDVEALGRLGAYVGAVQAAWADADKPQRRLLVRTLFEQLWVLGDQIVAVKPAAQFTPFFRLVQSTVSQDGEKGEGDGRDEGLQLLFVESAVVAETETVGAIAEKIARDELRHGREEARVRRGGPDGVGVRSARNAKLGTGRCLIAEKFGISIMSSALATAGDYHGTAWACRGMESLDGLQRPARLHGPKPRARPPDHRCCGRCVRRRDYEHAS
jgi:hypothetical protein